MERINIYISSRLSSVLKTVSLLLFYFFGFSYFVFGQTGDYIPLAPLKDPNGNVIGSTNLTSYLLTLYKLGVGATFVIAFVMLIIAGMQYIMTENIFSKSQARGRIKSAAIGIGLALASYIILYTINPDLVKLQFAPEVVKTSTLQKNAGTATIENFKVELYQFKGEDGKPYTLTKYTNSQTGEAVIESNYTYKGAHIVNAVGTDGTLSMFYSPTDGTKVTTIPEQDVHLKTLSLQTLPDGRQQTIINSLNTSPEPNWNTQGGTQQKIQQVFGNAQYFNDKPVQPPPPPPENPVVNNGAGDCIPPYCQ